MTERIYYTDPYRAAFDAVIQRTLTIDGRSAVVLDRTAFYPTSGGQPHDIGNLAGLRVLDVVDREDGSIAHVVDGELSEGAAVDGRIDWERRFDHMQQHTGQHLLSAAFARLSDNRTMSFHMSGDVSTIDLAREAAPDAIAEAEREANRVVWEDRSVTIRFVSGEEAAALPLRKEPSRGGTLRIIDIAGFDISACGGTHVSRTGAVGIVAVSAWERFRGGTRVTFVCGNRTLRLFRTYRESVTASVRVLSVLPHELPGAIDRVQSEAKELRRGMRALQESLARHEAGRLIAEAPLVNGVRIVARSMDGWDAPGLKSLAAAAVGIAPAAVALFSTAVPAVVVTARSAEVTADARALLDVLVARHGGRGGGRPELAQGGGLQGDVTAMVAAARQAFEQQITARA